MLCISCRNLPPLMNIRLITAACRHMSICKKKLRSTVRFKPNNMAIQNDGLQSVLSQTMIWNLYNCSDKPVEQDVRLIYNQLRNKNIWKAIEAKDHPKIAIDSTIVAECRKNPIYIYVRNTLMRQWQKRYPTQKDKNGQKRGKHKRKDTELQRTIDETFLEITGGTWMVPYEHQVWQVYRKVRLMHDVLTLELATSMVHYPITKSTLLKDKRCNALYVMIRNRLRRKAKKQLNGSVSDTTNDVTSSHQQSTPFHLEPVPQPQDNDYSTQHARLQHGHSSRLESVISVKHYTLCSLLRQKHTSDRRV